MVFTDVERFFLNHDEAFYQIIDNPVFSELFLSQSISKYLNSVPKKNRAVMVCFWNKIYSNPNISQQFLERHFATINWQGVTINPSIPEAFFERHLDKLDWLNISQNPGISEQFFDKYWDRLNSTILSGSGYTLLCRNNNISESLFAGREKYINWSALSGNTNISEEFFEKHITLVDWFSLSGNNNISENFFRRHLDKIVWWSLCSNTNISEQFFTEHIDKVCWYQLCGNTNISEEFFDRHLDEIVWPTLCGNTNISEKFFEKHLGRGFRPELLKNPRVSLEFIERHQMYHLSLLSPHACLETTELPLTFKSLLFEEMYQHPQLCPSFLERHKDHIINFTLIGKNPFSNHLNRWHRRRYSTVRNFLVRQLGYHNISSVLEQLY